MKDRKTCSLIRDLLPLWMEQLTSEETDQIIKEHLNECESCRKEFQLLREENPQGSGQPVPEGEVAKEIDYLKKLRIRSVQKIWIGTGITILTAILLLLFKVFIYGAPSEHYTASVSVENGKVRIEGLFWDSASVYSHYKIVEKDGEKRLVVYAALASAWNRNAEFTTECKADVVKENGLVINDRKITKSGRVISAYTAEIFSKKHAYIGDMSKNGALAEAIGISKELGGYTNELQTKKEPYGWKLSFQTPLEVSSEKLFNERIRSYACILLATVDNVSEITWEYNLKTKDGVQVHQEKLTAVQAKEVLGEDVKYFGGTEEHMEELLMKLGLVMPGNGEKYAVLSF